MESFKKEELINILKYSYLMSRAIEPISAEKIGLQLAGYDEISDFYKDIIDKIEKGENINFNGSCNGDNQYLKQIYESMKKDVENKDIECDGIFDHINEQEKI